MSHFCEIEKEFLKACRDDDLQRVISAIVKSEKAMLPSSPASSSIFSTLNSELGNIENMGIIRPAAGAKGFILACSAGYLDVVKYLINFKDYRRLEGFKMACEYEKINIIEFFIFDYKMSLNGSVEEALLELNNKAIKKTVISYFDMRKAKEELEKSITPTPLDNLSRLHSTPVINKI